MRVLLIILLLGVFLLPRQGTSSACEGYVDQAAMAVNKARGEMAAVHGREDGYQELAVSLLSKIRAVEDRLIYCGMRAESTEWEGIQRALGELNASTYPLRDLILTERLPAKQFWEDSDRSLAQVVQTLETKKPGVSKD